MSPELRNKILATVTALSLAGTGAYKLTEQDRIDNEALAIAQVVGSYYESSGKHIGTPYIDRIGKGQPLTVCDGVTGPSVVAGRYYTPEDCRVLETTARMNALFIAKRHLKHWSEYNAYVRASFIDVAYNVPSALTTNTTMRLAANGGNLITACLEMPRWIYGTVNGQKKKLPGLIDRRNSTAELCAEWGTDGHISMTALVAQTPEPEPPPAMLPPSLVIVPAPEAINLPWWQRIFQRKEAM